jgi:hypothetical protein
MSGVLPAAARADIVDTRLRYFVEMLCVAAVYIAAARFELNHGEFPA